jgi:acetolactate decarboxylase
MKYPLFILFWLPCFCVAQVHQKVPVKISGAMANVMMGGELFGTINLDTIDNKEHLYGIGPVEYLKGEIMIWDGQSYYSSIDGPHSMKVNSSFKLKAPFFVYTNVKSWKKVAIPKDVLTNADLEAYLTELNKGSDKPFVFKLETTVATSDIHVVNLPDGSKVASPADAHKGQEDFTVKDQWVHILGFFSLHHQGIFTHHTSYIHMHLMTDDHKFLGHVDTLKLGVGLTDLYLAQ